ncbi:uncharacterized protein PFL1_01570 [Pseudozyma flocculosa PF-1]|uniref:Uncharacterized protein n=1 Tax=Pseudozyma flocculosa TaxID=84751 RepID=A0A5C3EXP9_9BASI|nr:uncharacterized protein PFL1_01570 [Pseudozyma flocculosa PF-1]EPQ30669.1 hypothetical protein PFL1_01570 [Pseudozyma flocculosa PF-1]SPO36998.1 uncharacterized protein PSFLO_02470 [Pseudozyma flocculosa]
MTTTSRSRSLHRTGSSTGSQHGGRRPSVGKQAGGRGRFDPNLMMSTNAGDSDGARDRASEMGSRRKSVDGLKALEKAARRNKSSDRLHRGESSTNLSSAKRSKSSTQLAMARDERPSRRKEHAKQKTEEQETEDGWTSASATGTPIVSLEASPSTSPMDEGLVLGFKKRPVAQQSDSHSRKEPGNDRLASNQPPRTDMARTTSAQSSATPRVSATRMNDDFEPLQQNTLSQTAVQGQESVGASAHRSQEPGQRPTHAQPAAGNRTESSVYNGAGLERGQPRPPPLEREDTARTLRDEGDDADGQQELNSRSTDPRRATEAAQLQESPSAAVKRVADLRLDIDSAQSSGGSADQDGSALPADGLRSRRIRSESPANLEADAPSPSAAADRQARSSHHRAPSSASNRTLRSSVPMTSSPGSLRSRTSVLSNMNMLFPRENHGIVPPKLDTHNALAGALGARHEDRGDSVGPSRGSAKGSGRGRSGLPASASEPVGLDEMFPDGLAQMNGSMSSRGQARRKGSMSSMSGSGITLPSPSPSVGNIAPTTASRGANDFNSVRRGPQGSVSSLATDPNSIESSGILSPDRRRTTSTQSLTAADAARLAAKLRLARDSIDEHSATSALRGASASGFLSGGQRQGSNPRLEKYNKPVISNFAKDQAAGEAPRGLPVTHESVFSRQFSRPHESQDEVGGPQRRMYRYVMPSGLGGPPIEKSELSDALLGPSLDMDDFESSWAPALANAAGLGSRSMRHPSRNVEPEFGIGPHDTGASVNGPNSTPLHLIHGLTTTSPDAFPLDPTDVPALQEGGDLFDPTTATAPHGAIKFVDPALIRAIAMTSQAISTHRAHVVTRRYADPMRESLERMARSSGKWGLVPQAPVNTPSSPALSLSGGRWGGRKTAPNSPGLRAGTAGGASGGGVLERPGFARRQTSDASTSSHQHQQQQQQQLQRHGQGGANAGQLHNHLAGQLAHLVDAAEHPVRSLKRVWSGGLGRGGLAALTSTREETT